MNSKQLKSSIAIIILILILFVLGMGITWLYGLIDFSRFHEFTFSGIDKKTSTTLTNEIKTLVEKSEEVITIANIALRTSSMILSFISFAFALIVFFGLKEIAEMSKIRKELERECENSRKMRDSMKKDFEILNKLGSAKFLYSQKEYDQAWDLIENIPSDVSYEVPLYKGLINFKNKDINNAIKCLEEALERPDNVEKARTLCDIGNCHSERGLYNRSLKYYVKAIKTKSNYLPAFNGEARALRRLGYIDHAIEILEEAIKLDPNYELGYYNIACYKSIQNKQKESLSCLKRAIELKPKNISIARDDEDFENIRDLQEFKDLVENC